MLYYLFLLEGHIKPEIKVNPTEMSPSLEEMDLQRFVSDSPNNFAFREFYVAPQNSSHIEYQRMYTEEKSSESNQCRKIFMQRASLARHQRMHTGDKPYECKQYEKTFTKTSSLAVHQRIHTGKKTV